MLRNIFDGISRWFEDLARQQREKHLESAKTIEELERRMRDIDR